ncbi:MAG: hypothetical protein ACOYCB_02930 [Fastidiosipilaceae bacterium]|nr:DUF4276 family protein [Clostridiaceae bacterium]
MHIEILVEDKSGGVILDSIFAKICSDQDRMWTYSIHPHRGAGRLPDALDGRPKLRETTLLELLPAKLRAYRQLYCQGMPLLIVVVLDADDNPSKAYFNRLLKVTHVVGRELPVIIGLAVEELEAWLLGDEEAILKAYPDADTKVIRAYEQDSVCGTWEILCRAILRERGEQLIELGYPAVGKHKYDWASKISPHLDLENNKSPSFQRFYNYLVKGLELYRVPIAGETCQDEY